MEHQKRVLRTEAYRYAGNKKVTIDVGVWVARNVEREQWKLALSTKKWVGFEVVEKQ